MMSKSGHAIRTLGKRHPSAQQAADKQVTNEDVDEKSSETSRADHYKELLGLSRTSVPEPQQQDENATDDSNSEEGTSADQQQQHHKDRGSQINDFEAQRISIAQKQKALYQTFDLPVLSKSNDKKQTSFNELSEKKQNNSNSAQDSGVVTNLSSTISSADVATQSAVTVYEVVPQQTYIQLSSDIDKSYQTTTQEVPSSDSSQQNDRTETQQSQNVQPSEMTTKLYSFALSDLSSSNNNKLSKTKQEKSDFEDYKAYDYSYTSIKEPSVVTPAVENDQEEPIPDDSNNQLVQIQASSKQEVDTTASEQDIDNDYEPNISDDMSTLAIITGSILASLLVLKILFANSPCMIFITEPTLKNVHHIVVNECMIALTAILLFTVLDYYEFMDIDNWRYGIYSGLVAVSLWLLVGFFFIYKAQKQIQVWRKLEQLAQDYTILEEKKQLYGNLFYEQKTQRFPKDLIEEIRYFVMRLQFLNPIFLPAVNESYLRKDFNFANYLGYAYAKTLKQFFNSSWITIVLIMPISMGIGALDIHQHTTMELLWVNLVIPVLFIIAFSIYQTKFQSIRNVLHAQIVHNGEVAAPESINFQLQYNVIDPFNQYDNIPFPDYLENDNNDESEEATSRRIANERNSTWCCGLCSSRHDPTSVANKHESLFGCGRSGKSFYRVTLQIIFISSLIYLACFLVHGISTYRDEKEFNDNQENWLLTTIFLLPVVMLYLWISMVPQILKTFTVITNLEMMKDREIIKKVVTDQKTEKMERTYRVFQTLRTIRREIIDKKYQEEEANNNDQHPANKKIHKLRDFTVKQIQENFYQCCAANAGDLDQSRVPLRNFNSLVRLCGSNLSKQETFNLLKKAQYDPNQATGGITSQDFIIAVEKYMNDTKCDPYILVKTLFAAKWGTDVQIVPVEEVRQFLEVFHSYFCGNDLKYFLQDIDCIKEKDQTVIIDQIALMVRNDAECYPW